MIVAIIQARIGATRLPGKVMKELAGEPVLYHVVERTRRTTGLEKVIVATTIKPQDDVIENFCKRQDYDVFRGSSDDVLSRYYEAAKKVGADSVVRITADCPLIDPFVVAQCIEDFNNRDCDYLSNVEPGPRTFPRGLDTEVFSFSALERAHAEAKSVAEREHVTPDMWQNKGGTFVVCNIAKAAPEYNRPQYRLTLDFQEDYDLLQNIYGRFYKSGTIISVPDVIRYLDEHPEIAAVNAFREKEQVKK